MESSTLQCEVAQSKDSTFVWGVVLSSEDKILYWARLKDLTGRTFLDHSEYSKSLEKFLEMLESLVLASSGALQELELSQLQMVQEALYRDYLDRRMMTPGQFMELIYFLEGRKFNPNWSQWLDVPVTVLQEMENVVKQYPPITL